MNWWRRPQKHLLGTMTVPLRQDCVPTLRRQC
uniref:Uncharacterized protein n=1 Tax=Arundo donax TaxID=35708 RepID=A0A0A8ZPA4_ARUDO